MEKTYYNLLSSERKKITLKNETTICEDKILYCSCCCLELVRPSEENKDFYDNANNSINLFRSFMTKVQPYFYCRKCWDNVIEEKFQLFLSQHDKFFCDSHKIK